jgi:hypothetical protein
MQSLHDDTVPPPASPSSLLDSLQCLRQAVITTLTTPPADSPVVAHVPLYTRRRNLSPTPLDPIMPTRYGTSLQVSTKTAHGQHYALADFTAIGYDARAVQPAQRWPLVGASSERTFVGERRHCRRAHKQSAQWFVVCLCCQCVLAYRYLNTHVLCSMQLQFVLTCVCARTLLLIEESNLRHLIQL